MAYGGRIDIGWTAVLESKYYRVDEWIYYYLDPDNRKIRVVVDNQRIVNKSSVAWYWWRVNNGYQLLGGANDSQYGRVWDNPGDQEVNIQRGATVVMGVHPVSAVYSYNSDGGLSNVVLSSQMLMMVPSGYDRNYMGVVYNDWTNKDISNLFPKLAESVASPGSVTVDPNRLAATSATITWIGNSKAAKYELYIEGEGVSSTVDTVNTYYTFTNLDPNKHYKVSIVSVDKGGNHSKSITIEFTTKEQISLWVNVNGQAKKGYAWVNVAGKGRRVINAWVNVKGEARRVL